MEEIDDLTIKAAARGDEKAFRRLYDHYLPFVWSLAHRTANGSSEAAREIAQDTFVKLHGSLRSFRFGSAFSTWVYRVAYNASMTRAGRAAKELRRWAPLDDPASAEDLSGDVELRESVAKVLERLTPEERFLIVAREVHGVSFEELARITGRNEGALRTQLHRVRTSVRRELGDEEE